MNVSFTDNKYKVKVSYPLKQGLKQKTMKRYFSLLFVKVSYPLKQGLNPPERTIYFYYFLIVKVSYPLK